MNRLALLAALALAATGTAAAQPTAPENSTNGLSFDGPYIGISIGLHNVIGGSLVNGIDYLAQDSRPAVVLFGGWRTEFDNGLVLGLEGGFGFENGDLRLDDTASGLAIDYSNNFQFRYGGQIGWRLNDDSLVFAYVSETKRDFDVSGSGPGGSFTQSDEQGLLRYGLGLDVDLGGPFLLRGTIGSSRADFGDRQLNRQPDHPIDVELSALSQF
jgi:opacity protein-like surface antigen